MWKGSQFIVCTIITMFMLVILLSNGHKQHIRGSEAGLLLSKITSLHSKPFHREKSRKTQATQQPSTDSSVARSSENSSLRAVHSVCQSVKNGSLSRSLVHTLSASITTGGTSYPRRRFQNKASQSKQIPKKWPHYIFPNQTEYYNTSKYMPLSENGNDFVTTNRRKYKQTRHCKPKCSKRSRHTEIFQNMMSSQHNRRSPHLDDSIDYYTGLSDNSDDHQSTPPGNTASPGPEHGNMKPSPSSNSATDFRKTTTNSSEPWGTTDKSNTHPWGTTDNVAEPLGTRESKNTDPWGTTDSSDTISWGTVDSNTFSTDSNTSDPWDTTSSTSIEMPLPPCCDYHYQQCPRERDPPPLQASAVMTWKTLEDGSPDDKSLNKSSVVCSLLRKIAGEVIRYSGQDSEGGRHSQTSHCADLEWCVMDVSHRVHYCINGELYRWDKSVVVNVCMAFPDTIWIKKGPAEVALKSLFMIPITLVGVAANFTLLYTLARHRRLHTRVNLFIGNLAVADLLLAAVSPTLFMLEDFFQQYVLGAVGCKFQGFVQTFLMMVSVMSLTLVAGQRLAIVWGERLVSLRPSYKNKLSVHSALIGCCFVWLFAAIISSPLSIYRYFVARQWVDYEESFCVEELWVTEVYWPFLVVVFIWVPLVFLIVSYMAIFYKLDQHDARMRGRDHPVARKHRRRLLSLIFIILLVFLVCHTPYNVFIIVRAGIVGHYEEVDIYFDILWWSSHWLAYLNSILNPLIYGLTNEGFRKAWQSSCPSSWIKRRRATVTPASVISNYAHSRSTQRPSRHVSSRPQHPPATPLAIEALRGTGSQLSSSRIRGSEKITEKVFAKGKERRLSQKCTYGGQCTQEHIHSATKTLQESRRSNANTHQNLTKTTSNRVDVFVTETSLLPLSFDRRLTL